MTENISVSVYKDKPNFCNNANLRTIFISSDIALLKRIKHLKLECYDVNLCENSSTSNLFLISNNLSDYSVLERRNIDFIDVDAEFIYNTCFCGLHHSELDDSHFRRFLNIASTIFHKIKKDSDDRYSIAVNNAIKFPFCQYLSENIENELLIKPLDFIFSAIADRKKTIIQSLAGTGKSTCLIELFNQRFDDFYSMGINKFIVIEPTTAITLQLWQDFRKKIKISEMAECCFLQNVGHDDPYPQYNSVGRLYNGARKNEKQFAIYDSLVTIACIDSFNKIPKSTVEKSIVIVDEFHQLVNDYEYRNKQAFIDGWEKIQLAKRIVLMSATPNYYFCSNLHESFNYKLIHFQPKIKSTINLKPIIYKGKEKDIPCYAYDLADEKKQGLIFGKFDSKRNLQATHEYFNSLGIENEFFHSGNKERKENNTNYKSLMDSGFVSDSIKMLCSTSLLEAGVSIKNQVKFLFLVDCKEYQKAIQIINRPRINSTSGINTSLDVALFRSEYSEKNVRSRKYVSAGTLFHSARKIVNGLRNYEFDSVEKEKRELPSDIKFSSLVRESDSGFKINILGILHEMYKAENNSDLKTMLARMVRFDDRINLQETQFVNNAEIEQVKEIRSNLLENEKFNKEYLNRLLVDDSTRYDTIKSIIYLSKDINLKNSSRLIHKLQIIDKERCYDFIEQHKQAFVGTSPSKVLKSINFLMQSNVKQNMSSKDAIQILQDVDESKLRLAKNRLIAQERQKKLSKCPDELYILDRFNAEINKKTIERIVDCDKKKRRTNEYCWTAEQFKKIINKCRKKYGENLNFKPKTNDTALSLVRTFFQVASKTKTIDGKKKRMYKIVRKVKAKDITKKLRKNS